MVLGAPNGVISLETGKMLSDAAARKTYTTRYIPDRFKIDARHQYVDELVAHLTPPDRRYLHSALGYALRGNPSRRLYALSGERRGGKSTLLTALFEALGDVRRHGYSIALQIEALLATRWSAGSSAHQGNLFGLPDARIAIAEEPPAGSKFNEALLKDLTGGRPQAQRDVGEKALPARMNLATIFIAMNMGQEYTLDTKDPALADRVRVLRYPQLRGPVDLERTIAFIEREEVRQAMAALLVQWAVKTRTLPPDTPSVEAYTEQRRQDSIGQVGQYIEAHLEVTEHRKDAVELDSFIEAVAAACGGRDDKGRIEGLDRKGILRLARELHPKLPRAKARKSGLLWTGVEHRLQVDDGQSAEVDDEDAEGGISEMVCTRCGRVRPLEELDLTAVVCIAGCGDSDDAPPSAATGDGQLQPSMEGMPRMEHIVLDDALRAELARVEAGRAKVLSLLAQQGEADPGLSPDVIYAYHARVGTLQEELPTPVKVRAALLNRMGQGLRLFLEALQHEQLAVDEVEAHGGVEHIVKMVARGTAHADWPVEAASTDDFKKLVQVMRLEAREMIAQRRTLWQRVTGGVKQVMSVQHHHEAK